MKAIVFSGGGVLGAYQVGCLFKMMQMEEFADYEPDILLGVSVGALNAAYLSQFSSFRDGVLNLYKLWSTIHDKDVKKKNFPLKLKKEFPFVDLRRDLHSHKPLENLIKNNYKTDSIKKSNKKLRIGYVDVLSGLYREVDENSDFLLESILASCLAPPVFGPTKVNNSLAQDGGTRNQTPLKTAIEMGVDEIDVFLTNPSNVILNTKEKDVKHGLGYLSRTIEIILQEIWEEDLNTCQKINKNIDKHSDKKFIKLRICEPPYKLTYDPFLFSNQNCKELLNLGESYFRFKEGDK